MNTSTIPVIGLALLCILSVGVSASTLESTIQTDPDDVIDLDWDRLPIGQDAGATIQREMRENRGDGQPADRSRSDGEREEAPTAGASERVSQATQRMAERLAGTGPDGPDLLALLLRLLALLAAVAVAAALAVLAYRYANRHLDAGAPMDDDAARRWPPAPPTNEVERAWLAMVRELDVDRPWARTPAECAAAATDAGMDADAVELLTDAFEEVRYGGAEVTDDHRRHVRRGLTRLDIDSDGGWSS